MTLIIPESRREPGERPLPLAPSVTADVPDHEFHRYCEPLRNDILLGARPDETPQRFYAFNVFADEWRLLSDKTVLTSVLHPKRPWLAFVEGTPPDITERVVVADLRHNRTLFARDLPAGSRLAGEPFFLSDRDVLVLPLQVAKAETSQVVLEVWTITNPPVLAEEVRITPVTSYSTESLSSNGAWSSAARSMRDGDDVTLMDVYDFNQRRF